MDVFEKNFTDKELNNLCRLCLTSNLDNSFLPIFGDVNTSLDSKIRECLSLEVSENDGLPANVCEQCALKVDDWHNFKCIARTSLETLHRLVNPIKNEDDFECDVDFKLSEAELDSDEEDVPLINMATDRSLEEIKRNWLKTENDAPKKRNSYTKSKPYCNICDKKFVRMEELTEHKAEIHSEDPGVECERVSTELFAVYRCHVCFKDLKDRKSLRMHCRDEHDTKIIQPFCCPECPRQFQSWALLVIHERLHTGDKPYSCDLCGNQKFISLSSLRRHQLVHQKAFNCQDCGKNFNCDSALRGHIRNKHSSERPFLCSICGRSFGLAGMLNTHLISHSTERKYKCDICGFCSKTNGNHHRHMRTHSKPDVKTFHCETCGKAYETKQRLSAHLIIHKSVRPHLCKLCGKGFIYKNKLERHLHSVHAKQRPYSCNLCAKKLSTKFGLKLHWKTHEKDECGRGAEEKIVLRMEGDSLLASNNLLLQTSDIIQ